VQAVGYAALHEFAVPVLSVEVREGGVQILLNGDPALALIFPSII
jgi:hypothetical protein